jgi:hypothetical protein
MRNRLALPATLATMVLALMIGQNAWGQEATQRAPGRSGDNATAGQNQNQPASSEGEMIRGVVAAITAEGEATFDYRTNRAVMAEAAFLTVVASPVRSEAADSGRRADANDKERSASSGRKRHNVYFVWLSPRTKICETSAEHGKSNETQNRNQADKKEVTLDQLEVGDHVEIQFSRREESGANSVAHQTEQMRQKHGRHRTFVGNANSITIMAYKDGDRAGSKSEGNTRERNP